MESMGFYSPWIDVTENWATESERALGPELSDDP